MNIEVSLDENEIEIIECLLESWSKGDMGLYGNLSFQCVYNLMDKLGICSEDAQNQLKLFIARADEITGDL